MSLTIEIVRDRIQFESNESAKRWATEIEKLSGATAILGKGNDRSNFTVWVSTSEGPFFIKSRGLEIESNRRGNEPTAEIIAAFEAAEAADTAGWKAVTGPLFWFSPRRD